MCHLLDKAYEALSSDGAREPREGARAGWSEHVLERERAGRRLNAVEKETRRTRRKHHRDMEPDTTGTRWKMRECGSHDK